MNLETYEQIAAAVGYSPAAISGVIEEARKENPDVDDLHRLKASLVQNNSSLPDAVRGSNFARKLEDRGIPPSKVEDAIAYFERALTGEDMEKVIEAARKLMVLEGEYRKGYPEIISEFEEKSRKLDSLDSSSRELQEAIDERKRNIVHLDRLEALQKKIDARKITIEKLDSTISDQIELERLGFSTGVAKVLASELSKEGIDPRKAAAWVASALKEYRGLQKALEVLSERERSLTREIRDKEDTSSSLDSRVQVKLSKLESLKQEVSEKESMMAKLQKDHEQRLAHLQRQHEERVERLDQEYREKEDAWKQNAKNLDASLVARYQEMDRSLKAEHLQKRAQEESDTAIKRETAEKEISGHEWQISQLKSEITQLKAEWARYNTGVKSNLDRAGGNVNEVDQKVEKIRSLSAISRLVKSPQTVVEHPKILFRFIIPILVALLSYLESKKDSMINFRSIKQALEKLLSEMSKVESGESAVI